MANEKKYFYNFFSGGVTVPERIKKADDIMIGYMFYSQDISIDKNWGETLTRINLYRLHIHSLSSNNKMKFTIALINKGIVKKKNFIASKIKIFQIIKQGLNK